MILAFVLATRSRFVRMLVSCCAVGHTDRFKKDSGIGFYVLPADKKRRERWLRAISRDKWEPKASNQICGSHFIGSRPSQDPKDIQYISTLFEDRKGRVNTPNVDHE